MIPAQTPSMGTLVSPSSFEFESGSTGLGQNSCTIATLSAVSLDARSAS